MSDNRKVFDFFDNLANNFKDKEFGIDPNKIRLSDTDEEAIMNSRIDSMLYGTNFEEPNNSTEEKDRLMKKTVDALIEREIKDIFRE
jgi:hypothetical protein